MVCKNNMVHVRDTACPRLVDDFFFITDITLDSSRPKENHTLRFKGYFAMGPHIDLFHSGMYSYRFGLYSLKSETFAFFAIFTYPKN